MPNYDAKKKGSILFIVPDTYQDDNYFPLGPAYLASVLRLAGHKVEIYSQDIFHQPNEELADYLDNNNFDAVGVGFLAARYVETMRPLASIVNGHKKKAKFILGGHGPTAIPEYILKDTAADIIVLGEGEKVIAPLVDDILNRKDLRKRDGIAFRVGNKVIVNKSVAPIANLDEIPFPAWDLFPIEKYFDRSLFIGSEPDDKVFPIATSRGCVGRCSFCYRMEKGIRLRSLDNIFKEMKLLNSRYGITYFRFSDEMLLPSLSRIKEFVLMLKKLKIPVKYSCNARVELAKNKEILKMLKASGCKFLNLGLESLNQNVLNLMGKRTTVEDNYRAVENTIAAGIHPGLNFIWANPGDTRKSLRDIVKFLIKYDTLGQLRTVRPPTPFPGSPLYYQAIQDKKLAGPADFFDKFKNSERLTVNFTDLPDDEVYSALFAANSFLIKNHFNKRVKLFKENKKACSLKAEAMIDSFKRVYFPKTEADLKFRGSRHYLKK
ncbi:MAG: radical SAM protein [Patescibacteria group bacterium]|nr:radical SAM protein [Patescibacteria group bacterium]